MNTSIQQIEEMARVSASMVDAAVANDWEQLVLLEKNLLTLRRQLQSLEPGGVQQPGLSLDEQEHKATLIRKILEDSATLRTHIDPFMQSARKLLADGVRSRAVRSAYGAGGR